MALNYFVSSGVTYDGTTFETISSTDTDSLIGSPDTEDDFWNVGDKVVDIGANIDRPLYEGYFADGGHTFLVFSFSLGFLVHSPTASVADYPSNLGPYQPFTTTPLALCFAPGTLIAAPDGERPVETLRRGDPILTADGRTVPVTWVGRQTVCTAFARERARPVRVAAGAIAKGVPHRDLVLTADHALVIDGLAINAGALVNGTSVTLDPLASLPERVTYYHVETDAHEVILANSTPAESYVDYVQRRAFDNYAEYLEIFGEERSIQEMPLPRVSAARLVPPQIRARLDLRGAA